MPSRLSGPVGKLNRLYFNAANERERAIALSVTGASEGERPDGSKYVSFPPEPFAVADLKLNLPTLELDAKCAHWFFQYIEAAKRSIWIASLTDNQNDEPLNNQLYPYQRVGAWWLKYAERAILGDEMGLGKTVQALAAAQDCDKILIVTVPIAEHSVWETHVQRWLKRAAWVIDGDSPRRQSLLQSAAKQDRVVCIINYEMIQSRKHEQFPELWDIEWDCVIMDEAHKVQGRPARKITVNGEEKLKGSQTSKGAEELKAKRLYMLTGTPVWNKPDSLYGLLHVLDPMRFSSYWRFVEEYCQVVGGEYAREIVGVNKATAERLHNLLKPMLLRRLKEEVLTDLPSKTVQYMNYELDGWLEEAYWRLKEQKIHPVTNLPEQSIPMAYADMRRLLNSPRILGVNRASPKDEIIDDLVEQATSEGKPVVIFTWHKDYTAYLRERLGKSYVTEMIDGDVPAALRDRILTRFQSGFTQVLVASMATMSVAIDLTVARVAIFAEGHYVNTVVDQAESRLHRNGQKCDVMIYRLQATDTIEAAIWEVAEKRKEDADEMLARRDLEAVVAGQHHARE